MINKKSISRFLLFVLIFFILSFITIIFVGCTKEIDYTYLVNKNYISTNTNIFTDKLGITSLKPKTDKNFKILQLTDIHIGYGPFTTKKDKKALEAVCNLIENTNPDLIILTGDVVFPVSIITGNNDNLAALKAVANVIDKYKTPWTMCFGNHDAESFAKYSKTELCEYLESQSLDYCIFQRGPDTIDGMGNQIINIYNFDNSYNSSIFLFDNGMYYGESQISGYQEITDSQVQWYSQNIEKLYSHFNQIPISYVFYHVPGLEYKYAWEAYKNNDENVKYFFGYANEKNEKISSPNNLGSFYETMMNLQSTKAIFCGHDHFNDFSLEYYGVRYTYSKSIDYTAYAFQGIANKTEQRGGTVLSLKGVNTTQNNIFDIYSIKLTDIN